MWCKSIKQRKSSRLQLNENKSNESQTRLMSWYWKRKPTWRKDLITYNIHPWIMFSFNWLVSFGEGCSFELGRPTSRGWKNFGRRWTRVVGGLENWTIFMDVICISSLSGTDFFDRGFTTHSYCVKKLLGAHRYGHSVFTIRKKIKFLLYFCGIWYPVYYFIYFLYISIPCISHNRVKLWSHQFQLFGVTASAAAVKILKMSLWGVYLNSFEKSAPSKTFLKRLNQICRAQFRKKHVSVAGSEKCYLILTGPSFFVFYIQLGCNKTFRKIIFHWYSAYLTCSFQFQAEANLGYL